MGVNAAPKDGCISNKNMSVKKIDDKKSNIGLSTLNITGLRNSNLELTLNDCNEEEDEKEFNVYFHSSSDIRRYLEQDFEIGCTLDIKNHYLHCEDFEKHPVGELLTLIFALIKALASSDHKFSGYMKKKTEDLKQHYWMLPNISALCTPEE